MESAAERKGAVVAGAAIIAGVAALQWFYVVAPLLHAKPLIWQDSIDYVRLSATPINAIFTRSRPPLYPYLIHLLGHHHRILIVQGVVSAASFDILALAVFDRAGRGWFRYAAAAFIACMAVSQSISLWNYSILTESFTLSVNALAVASWVRLRGSRLLVPALGLTAFAGAMLRDSEVMLFLLLAVALVVYGIYSKPERRVQWAAAVCVAAVVLGALYVAAGTKRTSVYLKDVFAVRIFPYPGRVAWFAAHGMPDSVAIDTLARNVPSQPGSAKVVVYDAAKPAYAALNAWFRDAASREYLLFLATHPGYVLFEPFQHPTQSFNSVAPDVRGYAPLGQSYPRLVDDIVFPPGWLLLVGSLVAAAFLLGDEEADEKLFVKGTLLVAIGIVLMLIVWHAEGQEIARHNLESDVVGRLGVMVALASLGVTASSASGRGRGAPDSN
ncbi:MAG: hypothetical protein M0Z34_04585 [Nitrospiraceae bacterium]|nr:hypothetical protein [Nitrospiraceae bacterium]MDA8261816.1 hypothetical protein [Actinomycetota bacterium]